MAGLPELATLGDQASRALRTYAQGAASPESRPRADEAPAVQVLRMRIRLFSMGPAINDRGFSGEDRHFDQ